MALKIWLNGKLVEKGKAKVSVFDHGLLYGDGVFEGIRAYHGKIFKLAEHLDRLYGSARIICLKIPLPKKQLQKAVMATVKANHLQDAYIRLVVTRGEGDLGLDPQKCSQPTVFIIADKIKLYAAKLYEKGLSLVIVSTRRNLPEALNPRVKSLNYLNNILAKIEANLSGVPEAIMLNKDGWVVECTGDNIFIVKKSQLITPPTCIGALAGITRNTIIQLAQKLEIPVKEKLFTPDELYNADECFLTGTAAEIIPVVKVDGRVIADGEPGPITKKLSQLFHKLTQTDGVKIG